MPVDRLRFYVRSVFVAVLLGAFTFSATAPSDAIDAAKVKYGASFRITVKNFSSKYIWLTPYGSTTLDPAWHIVSAHLTCLPPGGTKQMDLFFPAATPINQGQVKFQAEATSHSNCSNASPGVWSSKCTKAGGDVNLGIAYQENKSFSAWENC